MPRKASTMPSNAAAKRPPISGLWMLSKPALAPDTSHPWSMPRPMPTWATKMKPCEVSRRVQRDARAPWLIIVQNEPRFDFLHSDPRYQALIKKIGLQFVP